mgnify:CR=1 FL=1
MKKLLIVVGLLAGLQTPAIAMDVEALLIDQCSSCHGTEVYTRANKRVNNLLQLEKQLYRCNQAINANWDHNTVTAVMDYLNARYYKFKE